MANEKILNGKLTFFSMFEEITCMTGDGSIDLRNEFFSFFTRANGKPATMDTTMNSISIKQDLYSENHIKYENDDRGILIMLKKTEGFGMSNLMAYLPDMLQRLNGRQIILNISDTGIHISADPSEKVFGLYYTNGNSCKIPEGKEKEICKIGTTDCCIFCTVGSRGFECEKFSSYVARHLLDRHRKKEMVANRIGNCEILGRID